MTTNDEAMLDAYPGEPIDHDAKFLFRGYLEHQLVLPRCAACGHWSSLLTPCCPVCLSFDLDHPTLSGRGTIYSLIWLHQGPPTPGVDYSQPYPVVTVELAEQQGLRLTAPLVDADAAAIAIGDAVEVTWIERAGSPFPAFRPVGGRS